MEVSSRNVTVNLLVRFCLFPFRHYLLDLAIWRSLLFRVPQYLLIYKIDI